MKTKLTLVSVIGVLALLLVGCGGEGISAPPSNQFAGRHNGDVVFEAGGRGGGPSLQLTPLVVNEQGVAHGTAYFQDAEGSHSGLITGNVNSDGTVGLSTEMDGMRFTVNGKGLRWVVESAGHETRGGSTNYVTGTVTVTKRVDGSPYGQAWANARIMFWPE